MYLPSTKTLCIAWRPSSTSARFKRDAGALDLVGAFSLGASATSVRAAALFRLFALLSISVRAARASGSSGKRWRILSYSRIADESWPRSEEHTSELQSHLNLV